ncbi:MAG: CoA transferase subunit A [Anaerolineae bacterium]|jgi:acyl CoA:acetate/3-ketoacid CoA transferase alpha subunit|nr:CoA transferase subunit A [Anaerolineae bacterium]MDH7474596.1 CoA-transferase [Anaerolineae bacterium]
MTKLSTLAEAVASIPSGAHVALSGFAITRCNMAFAREVIRQGIRRLTVSQCVGAMDADMLAGAGAVERIIYGGGSLDRFGRLNCVNRGIEEGTLVAEEYSSLSLAFRYLAGALGLPFIPIRSLRGSDILKRLQELAPAEIGYVDDPFTGDNWLVLKPLIPDVAVVQVQVADEGGNAWIMGPRWDNEEQVKASKRTIVITEHLVPTEVIRREPERTLIPGFRVSHVVHLPFAAHPTSVYRAYDYDAEHIRHYAEATKTPEGFQKYLDKYVYGVQDHWGYLELVGGLKHLNNLIADPILGY